MRVVIGDRFRRWSSSSIAFRRWGTGILLVTHDSSVRPSPHSPRNRRQFLACEASAAVGGFVHPHITPKRIRATPAPEAASIVRVADLTSRWIASGLPTIVSECFIMTRCTPSTNASTSGRGLSTRHASRPLRRTTLGASVRAALPHCRVNLPRGWAHCDRLFGAPFARPPAHLDRHLCHALRPPAFLGKRPCSDRLQHALATRARRRDHVLDSDPLRSLPS